jgi:signal transduction histidine kinase
LSGNDAHLRRFAAGLGTAALAFALLFLGMGWRLASGRVAAVGGLLALLTVVALAAWRTAANGERRSVGLALAWTTLGFTVGAVLLLPAGWPALCVAALLAAVLALRFLDGASLRWLLATACGSLVFCAGVGQILPAVPVPSWFRAVTVVGGTVVAALFTIALVWQLRTSLRGSLEDALAAQEHLEQTKRGADFLARAGEVLVQATEPEGVLTELAALSVPELADWCTAVLGGPDQPARRVAALHRDPAKNSLVDEYLRRFPPGEHPASELLEALRSGRAHWTLEVKDGDLEAAAQDAEHLDLMRRLGTVSAGVLPLIARGRVLGILSLMRSDPARPFGPHDVALAEALVERAALALDNTRLLSESRRLEERRGFLAEASLKLAQSLDPEPTLKTLAQLAVPRVADWCIVDVMEGDDMERVAVTHRDPAQVRWAESLRHLAPREKGSRPGLEEALRTGVPILRHEVNTAQLDEAIRDPELRAAVAEMGIRSSMTIPMRTRGRTIGVLTLLSTDPGRLFDGDDLTLAEELALRAALAIDNARLFRDAQQAIGLREDVLAVVSHDLNNLLQPILAAGGLLARRLPDEGRSSPGRQARMIERSAAKMARMIRDLLDAASLDSGQLSLQMAAHDAAAVAREVSELIGPSAEEKGLAFRSQIPDGAIPVRCDRGRLAQVLANLLSNAVKFTAAGEVTLDLRRHEGSCVFEVRDTGPGIDGAQLPNVFDRYWRGRPAQAPGAGLGLYIAKGLVEAQGGRIWVESQVGKGTTFRFALPLVTSA